jgi:hypothetical protein
VRDDPRSRPTPSSPCASTRWARWITPLLALAVLGCSERQTAQEAPPSPAVATQAPAVAPPAPPVPPAKEASSPIAGVWDFVTDAKAGSGYGLVFLRGTLYVASENGTPTCQLKAIQETHRPSGETEKSSAEQTCKIFVHGNEVSISSTVTRGAETYAPDDFKLRIAADGVLVGELLSVGKFRATFARRGMGHQLADPILWRERDHLKEMVESKGYIYMNHGDTGCAFGRTGSLRSEKHPGWIAVEFARVCRQESGLGHVLGPRDGGGALWGVAVDCQRRVLYDNWNTELTKELREGSTSYATADGRRHSMQGARVPRVGQGDPPRLDYFSTAQKFSGSPLNANSVFSGYIQEECSRE